MKKFLFAFTLTICYAWHASAQEWKDVAPIFYNNCSGCHRTGEIGPFPIMSFKDASNPNYIYSIQANVNSGLMPPWKTDVNYRHFLDERILSQTEKNLISSWIDAGTPAGDTTLAPPPPVFPSGSQLGIPDKTLTMAVPHITGGNGVDDYVCFVLPTDFATTQNISAIEFRPDNGAAVHHVFIYLCPDSSAYYLDLTTPEYGYPSFGGAGDVSADFLGLYGPGMVPRFYPAGGGIKFPPNSFLIIQIHYAPLSYVTTDQSSVNLFFTPADTIRPVIAKRVGEGYITNGPFLIKANQIDTFFSTYPIVADRSLFAIAPHQHLLGKAFKIYAVTPETDTIPLIHVPNWDFNWQLLYSFPFMIKLPKNTVIHATAVYDNTIYNPNNPNNPPKDVHYGESSTDEMFKYLLNMLKYQTGDEYFVIDSNYTVPTSIAPPTNGIVSTFQLYDLFPNPSGTYSLLNFYNPFDDHLEIRVTNFSGQLVFQKQISLPEGFQRIELECNRLENGIYGITIIGSSGKVSKMLAVQR